MVLDPVSALGVAAGVAQFINFGTKVISGSLEITKYKITESTKSGTGRFSATKDLESITKDLHDVSSIIEQSSCARNLNRDLTSNELELQSLCKDCREIASDLIAALEKLKAGKQDRWGNFRQALKCIWGEEKIKKLSQRLDGFRQQLIIKILESLR